MEQITSFINYINGIVWGPAMLFLILGTGFFLMIGLKLMPLHRLGYGFRMLWKGREGVGEGDITPFNALMTSLSATIGTGNIGCRNGNRAGGAGGLVLDVVHGPCGNGHEIRGGGVRREFP